jgi:hypothetical protein
MEALHKKLHTQHVMYQFNHRKPMACPAMAQLLSNTLYQKRFFPFYTFNLCAGLDDEGELQPCSSTLWQAVVRNDYGRTMRQIAADGPPQGRCRCRWPSHSLSPAGCTCQLHFAKPCVPPALYRPIPPPTAGRGAVYTYDAIGSYERVGYGVQGSGKELIQPVLDNQLKAASPLVLPQQVRFGRARAGGGSALLTKGVRLLRHARGGEAGTDHKWQAGLPGCQTAPSP